jgi:hypothetical protein
MHRTSLADAAVELACLSATSRFVFTADMTADRSPRQLKEIVEQRCVLRRIQTQADDIGGFLLEVRIVLGHVMLEPLGLQPVPLPHSSDHHVRESERLGQLARAPVCGTIAGLELEGPFQDPGV